MTEPLSFWTAVAAMAGVTYLTRALPFLLSARSPRLQRLAQGKALAVLGPALLAGIAAAVIVPDVIAAGTDAGRLAAYLAGLAATAGVARRWRNTGAAVLAGLAAYALLRWLAGA